MAQNARTNISSRFSMPDKGEIYRVTHDVSLTNGHAGLTSQGSPACLSRGLGIALGVLADNALGDPANKWHPVAWFGSWAGWLEQRMFADSVGRGAAFMGIAIAPVATAGIAIELLTKRQPIAHTGLTALVTWACIGADSLATEGFSIAQSLEAEDLEAARKRLPHLCGRLPHALDADELARATIESMAENTSDCGISSLWWGSLFGIPAILVHRAANTLDAMVGHHSSRYENFGKTAAKLDDLLNLVPARITGVLACLCAPSVGGKSLDSAHIMLRDANNHPSPNGGWCEAAWAGALGVRLGGKNIYPGGRVERRGFLGQGNIPTAAHTRSAATLVGKVMAAGTVLAIAGCLLFQRRHSK